MKKIWENDVLDDYELDLLDDKMVEKAEGELGVSFPKSYTNLLKERNGGYLKYNRYPYVYEQDIDEEDSTQNADLTIDFLYGISTKRSEGILQSHYFIKEWELPKNIVVLSNDGERFIAFDYRKSKTNPPIILIDAEMDFEDVIAQDFDKFLGKLYEEENDIDSDGANDYSEYTHKEAEKLFEGDLVGEIEDALLYFLHEDNDTEWLLTHLERLVHSNVDFVPHVAAETLYELIDTRYRDENLENRGFMERIMNHLKKSDDPDLQRYSKKLESLVVNKKTN